MGESAVARWEREVLEQAMDGELYLAGKRAGATAAGGEWPRVERGQKRQLAKGMHATKALFGGQAAERNTGYWAGWVDGYRRRCDQLDER